MFDKVYDCITIVLHIIIGIASFICVFPLNLFKSRKRNPAKKRKVIVLYACSAYNQANYIKAFQSFARENFDVEFGTKRKRGCKCILLCDVVSRIPEDVQWVLHNLGLDGRSLDDDTMIVAMHNHAGGKIDNVCNFIGTEDDPLHILQLRNMFYSEEKLLKCSKNDTAKQCILSFVNGSLNL